MRGIFLRLSWALWYCAFPQRNFWNHWPRENACRTDIAIHTWGQQSAATSSKDLSLSTSDLRLERDISKSLIWLWLLSSSIRMAWSLFEWGAAVVGGGSWEVWLRSLYDKLMLSSPSPPTDIFPLKLFSQHLDNKKWAFQRWTKIPQNGGTISSHIFVK